MISQFTPSTIHLLDPAGIQQAADQLRSGASDFRAIAQGLRSIDATSWSGTSHDLFLQRVTAIAGYLDTTAALRDEGAAALTTLIGLWAGLKFTWANLGTAYNSSCALSQRTGVGATAAGSGLPALPDGPGTLDLASIGRWRLTSVRVDAWATAEGRRFLQTAPNLAAADRQRYAKQIVDQVSRRVRDSYSTAEAAAYKKLRSGIDAAVDAFRRASDEQAAIFDGLTARIPGVIAAKQIEGGLRVADPFIYENALALQRMMTLGPAKAANDDSVRDHLKDPEFQELMLAIWGPKQMAAFYSELPAGSAERTTVTTLLEQEASDEYLQGFVGSLPYIDFAELLTDSLEGGYLGLGSRMGLELTVRYAERAGYLGLGSNHGLTGDDVERLTAVKKRLVEMGFGPIYANEMELIAAKFLDGGPEVLNNAARLVIRVPSTAFFADGPTPLTSPMSVEDLMTAALSSGLRADVQRVYLDHIANPSNWPPMMDLWPQTYAAIYIQLIDLPGQQSGDPLADVSLRYPPSILLALASDPIVMDQLANGVTERLVQGMVEHLPEVARLLNLDTNEAGATYLLTNDQYLNYLTRVHDILAITLLRSAMASLGELKPEDDGDFVEQRMKDYLSGKLVGKAAEKAPIVGYAYDLAKTYMDYLKLNEQQDSFDDAADMQQTALLAMMNRYEVYATELSEEAKRLGIAENDVASMILAILLHRKVSMDALTDVSGFDDQILENMP